MPRAEVGSTKWQANKQKAKGLGRLRWYCQACEKQCRDENGFKCHTQSESHVRQMMLIGEDPRKHISDFSNQFLQAFITQLKTAHGTKQVHINHFYQEYIQDKEHVHMNASKWKSLTQFAQFLGQEGLCRVEETDKGVHISWIDNSPEALRRQAAVQKQERSERNDEELQRRLLREQMRKAEAEAQNAGGNGRKAQDLERIEGEKIKFSLGAKQTTPKPPTPPQSDQRSSSGEDVDKPELTAKDGQFTLPSETSQGAPEKRAPVKMSLGMGNKAPVRQKPRSMAALFGAKKTKNQDLKREASGEQPKKVSEAERVMRQDMERIKTRGPHGMSHGPKRVKLG